MSNRYTAEAALQHGLVEAWIISDSDFTDVSCETCAREWAESEGLAESEYGSGYVSPTDDQRVAYPTWYPGELLHDTPHSCGGCGLLLDHSLTSEGEQYVRDNFPAESWSLWGVTNAQ